MKRHFPAIALLLCATPSATAFAHGPIVAAAPSRAEVARYANDLLMRRYRADGPGGAVLVARGNTILFRGARGEADIASHTPLRPDSVFRIASVTKQFTAAGLLKLVEAGKVKLDEPVSAYLPAFPRGDRITLRQLLNHTSGIKEYADLPTADDTRVWTTAALIDLFKNEQPDFEPGTRHNYSNSNYVLIAAVIEAVTGQPWHAYLDRALFRPLGLRNTGFGEGSSLAARQVSGYSYQGDNAVPASPISLTKPHAAGGLVSTIDDLFRWNRALHEGRVLKSDTYRQMITPAGAAGNPGVAYGFGIRTGDTVRAVRMLQHGGAISGFIASLVYLPGPDVTIVLLENDDRRDDTGGDSAETSVRRLAALALGDPYPEARAAAIDPAALRQAEGAYRFDGDVWRFLEMADGKLVSRRGSRGDRQPLTQIGPDDYLYPDGLNRLKLERNADGTISRARYFFRGDGDGEVGIRSTETAQPAGVQLPRAALERLTGTYVNRGLRMEVSAASNALTVQLGGQDPLAVRATSPTRFVVEENGALIDFAGGDGPAGQVTVTQNGREMMLTREAGAGPSQNQPAEPAATTVPRAALERVVGTYANGGLTLKVYLEGGALLGQIAGQPPVTLRAKSPTRFDVEETGASVEFPAGGAPAGEVTMRQGGREMVLKREAGARPE